MLLKIPEFLPLEYRYALSQESLGRSCGPTLACDEGIPWASTTLSVSNADADAVLARLLATPDARPLYANMARTQGIHYANPVSIRSLAKEALTVLQQYHK